MELRIESADGFNVPAGCYVGVRVGEVLKQGRYEPQRCYHFPTIDRRRNAKIDIYRHVGSSIITVDPDAHAVHDVGIASSDPSTPEMRFKVNIQVASPDNGKERENRSKVVKNQAKDYLTKYNIEERLSEAVKALLKEQPANPTDFLCRHLQQDGHKSVAQQGVGARGPAEAIAEKRPAAGIAAPQQGRSPLGSFLGYYRSQCLPHCGNDFFYKLHSQFPGARRVAPNRRRPVASQEVLLLREQARDVLVKACQDGSLQRALRDVRPQVDGKAMSFALLPSVATWLAPRPPEPKSNSRAFNLMPSVGTWLAQTSHSDVGDGTGKGSALMLSTSMMLGPQFYSVALPHTFRVV